MLAAKNNPVASTVIPFTYLNNPRIMKIVNDCYGSLNDKFNPRGVPITNNFPPPVENCHFILSGNEFIPVPMDISIAEANGQSRYKSSLPNNETRTSRQISQYSSSKAKNNESQPSLMPLPMPVQNRLPHFTNSYQSTGAMNSSPSTSTYRECNKLDKPNEQLGKNNSKSKNYKIETIFLTGTIERLIRWNRDLEDLFCIYETIAPIVSLQEGRIKNQKIMLLRDKKGPILQVHYYSSTHIDINDFYIGQYLRCMGRMIGYNILSAESIREAKESEISTLARLSYVCNYSVTHNLNRA